MMWFHARVGGRARGRAVVWAAGALVALAVALSPGTGVRSTLAYLRLAPGQGIATGTDRRFALADVPGAVRWLRPRLRPGDRVVATDWLTTRCYLERVDAWSRGRRWAQQSRLREGVVRDVYLGAEVLPDLDALQRYVALEPTWVVAGGREMRAGNPALDPNVRAWLLEQEASYVGGDGETRVYGFGVRVRE